MTQNTYVMAIIADPDVREWNPMIADVMLSVFKQKIKRSV